MKAMNKIMLVLAIVMISVMNVKAQGLATMPSAGFRSTSSSMYQSGSAYQSAAVGGYISADEYYGSNISRSSNIRRIGGGDDEEEWEEGGDEHLQEVDNPIGDGLWVMLLMVVGFAGVRGWRCWRRRVELAE